MLFVPPHVDLEGQSGLWTREQHLEMDNRFTAAVEAAFQARHESRAVAAATVRIGYRNGKQRAEEAAIEAGWNWLRKNMSEGKDVTSAAVVAFVRERCPGVDHACIREGVRRRLMDFASNAVGSLA